MISMAYPYWDYKKQAFTASSVDYIIGTVFGRNFIAEEIVLYCTEDCFVKFGKGPLVFIPKEVYFEWYARCGVLSIVRDTANGDLHIWAEGHTGNP